MRVRLSGVVRGVPEDWYSNRGYTGEVREHALLNSEFTFADTMYLLMEARIVGVHSSMCIML